METSVKFRIALACLDGVTPDQLSINFSKSFDREVHPNQQLEKSIDQTWTERLKLQPSLYSGTKFRYGGSEQGELLNGNLEASPKVTLFLGLTDYKHHIGTNLSPIWQQFLVPTLDPADPLRCRHMAMPLGNAAIVVTRDNKILVLKRGTNVGEAPGAPVFPGGHSEPSELEIYSHDGNGTDAIDLSHQIAKEMFEGIIREVVEETGAPASSLSNLKLIGVAIREENMRPTAHFTCSCSLSADEVQQCYRTAIDTFESSRLLCLSLSELQEVAKDMPGCHMGGAALYMMMLVHQGQSL